LKIAFQADADLDPDIGRGLRRREPAIDFRAAAGVIQMGRPIRKYCVSLPSLAGFS
jgi:hypothetical protein